MNDAITIPVRLDFDSHAVIFSKAMAQLDQAATEELDCAGIDRRLRELLRIRASQLNGCAYCVDMHTKDARAGGEADERLTALPVSTAHTISVAERAVGAVRELTHLTRPAITALQVEDLYALTGALVELTTTMPQILAQLSGYLDPNTAADARADLSHARRVANDLADAVDTAHQTLGDTAETNRTNHEGVSFQPTQRGQFSAVVDIAFESEATGRTCLRCPMSYRSRTTDDRGMRASAVTRVPPSSPRGADHASLPHRNARPNAGSWSWSWSSPCTTCGRR